MADFSSRSPISCEDNSCDICKFIQELCDNVVDSVSVDDLVSGKVRVPFTNRSAWLATQKECRDLEKVRFHLSQGSPPSRKHKNLKEVRRYLHSGALIASDGVIIVRESKPFKELLDRIVVPKAVCMGLLMALHLQCSHPSGYQLKRIFNRYFFALGVDDLIDSISKFCEQCAAVKDIPTSLIEQSTCEPPVNVGFNFAADVMKRERQNILVLRETVTSFTMAMLIQDEKVETLKSSIVSLVSKVRPSTASPAFIRVDPATAFQSIFNRLQLSDHNIILEVGRFKNRNKNPVIDKAIKELEREIRLQNPIGGPLSSMSLDMAIATLNSRLRHPGLSSQEMWTGRDQVSGEQLALNDRNLIDSQHRRRIANHSYSEKAKAKGHSRLPIVSVKVGDLVYLYSDGNKHSHRPRYIVTDRDSEWITIKKLQGGLFSNRGYKVKYSEIFKIPIFNTDDRRSVPDTSDSSEDEDLIDSCKEDPPPDINQDDRAVLPVHPGCSNTGPPRTRSGREVKRPARLADYIE